MVIKKTNKQQDKPYKINKNDLLSDVFEKCPRAMEILAEHGLYCIGCIAMQFETVEQGAKAHGMEDSQIEKMIEEINSKLNK